MNVRTRHLIAYAASMISLMVWQIVFSTKPFALLSEYQSDVYYTLVSQILCMGIIPLGILFFLTKGNLSSEWKRMRYVPPRDPKSALFITVGLMLLITPFTMVFNALTNLLFSIIGYKRGYPAGFAYLGVGDLFLMIGTTAILPAVFEEFTHRGLLLSGLEYRGSEKSAVILSAVLFGLMHGNPSQLIYATFGGLLFGTVVVKTGSVLPALCAHFANNAVSVILDYSTEKQNALGMWYDKLTSGAGVLSVAVTFVVLALSLYGVVKLLQYASRKAPKPISQGMLFGLITIDVYSPEGKATLKDNAVLYSLILAESVFVFALLLWGILR